MASRRGLTRLYYFTVEDEGILAEAFPKFEQGLPRYVRLKNVPVKKKTRTEFTL